MLHNGFRGKYLGASLVYGYGWAEYAIQTAWMRGLCLPTLKE